MAAALWDLGFDLLGLDKGLDSLSTCAHGPGVVSLQVLWALLVLLGKVQVPQELGVHPLKRFVSLGVSWCCLCTMFRTGCVWCGSWAWS